MVEVGWAWLGWVSSLGGRGSVIEKSHLDDSKYKLLGMHSWKVFHLDIKPENILYSPKFDRFVFCDFGFNVAKGSVSAINRGLTSEAPLETVARRWGNFSEATEGEVDPYINDF